MSVTAGVGEEAARPSSGCDDAPSPHRSEATCPARRESESGIAVYRRHQASTKIVAGLNFSPSMLLSAQWRGGSTVTEQLVFTTCKEGVFVLDEPAAVAKVLGSSLSHMLLKKIGEGGEVYSIRHRKTGGGGLKKEEFFHGRCGRKIQKSMRGFRR